VNAPSGPCPEGADEATGFSKRLSFDEAFADAIAKLRQIEPQHPDMLQIVRVAEIGGLFGGIAGFHECPAGARAHVRGVSRDLASGRDQVVNAILAFQDFFGVCESLA
jgi:hypothetical protein